MKGIKDFVNMMEGRSAKINDRYDEVASDYNHGAQSLMYSIITSKEYTTLKAAVDKPISKMEITDEMVEIAVSSFIAKQGLIGGYFKPITTALETVFNHISHKGKKGKLEEINAWKIEAEELALMVIKADDLNMLKEVTLLNYPQFKTELLVEKQVSNKCEQLGCLVCEYIKKGIIGNHIHKEEKICGGCKVNLNQDVCVCGLIPVEEKQGEWVEWNGGVRPIDIGLKIDVCYRQPLSANYKSGLRAGQYDWEHYNYGGDILAYRIIPEPKEIKKEGKVDCDCWGICNCGIRPKLNAKHKLLRLVKELEGLIVDYEC